MLPEAINFLEEFEVTVHGSFAWVLLLCVAYTALSILMEIYTSILAALKSLFKRRK